MSEQSTRRGWPKARGTRRGSGHGDGTGQQQDQQVREQRPAAPAATEDRTTRPMPAVASTPPDEPKRTKEVAPGTQFRTVDLAVFALQCPGRTIQLDFGQLVFDGNAEPQQAQIWITPVVGGHPLSESELHMGQVAFLGVAITSTMGAARGHKSPLDQTVDRILEVGKWFHWDDWGSTDANVESITVL